MSGEDDSSGWQLTESDPGVFTCVRGAEFYMFQPVSCVDEFLVFF